MILFAKHCLTLMRYIAHFSYMSRDQIIRLIEALARAVRRSPHTVGHMASGSGDFYARLKRGHDLTTRRAARVAQYLSNHWPTDLPWPSDIPRPAAGKTAGGGEVP